ncbi:MAG: LmeA family phospholipid-binding protein [Armatimonadota bacterium]
MRRWLFCVLAALLGLVTCGCGPLDPIRAVERGIARHAAKRFGPADRYEVRIGSAGTNLRKGVIGGLVIEGYRVRTKPGLTVNWCRVELRDVRFEPRSRSITSVGDSSVVAEVLEQDANAYLSARQDSYSNIRVELIGDGEMAVVMEPRLVGVPVTVRLEGRPEVRGGSEIAFVPDAVRIARLNLPRRLLGLVERRVNPILRVDELGVPVVLEDVRVEQGKIVAVGAADVNALRSAFQP